MSDPIFRRPAPADVPVLRRTNNGRALRNERMENQRQRWTDSSRRRKNPSLYDEFLREERAAQQSPRRTETPLQRDTIRAVTPDSIPEGEIVVTDTQRFEREFLPSDDLSPRNSPRHVRQERASARHAARGMLASSNGDHGNGSVAYAAARPRTRTLEEKRTRDRSPGALLAKTRNRTRMASVHAPGSPRFEPAEYMSSRQIPSTSSPPSATARPVRSPIQHPVDRSVSPISSAAESISSVLPTANTRRILHLIKTLNGRMSGNLVFRRGSTDPWASSYCFIQTETGSLMYEPRGDASEHKTLIPDLRGCKVKSALEDETPYLVVELLSSGLEIHLKFSNHSDFDSWFAALLCWQPVPPKGMHNRVAHPQPPIMPTRPLPPENHRRHSEVSMLREAPIIKVGKMIFWDTNVSYSNVGTPSTARPQAHRMQSYGSRRWRRISCTLRENGELKLYSEADVTLVSVVQLSQLSRCAIQRLDPSVLDNEFCIAIYPQYSATSSSLALIRPIFLSLESRVLYEVWFVLLRAFTIPQLYGPKLPSTTDDLETPHDLENLLATSTTDMFRMERSLSIRIIEAKLYPPTGSASPEQGFSHGTRYNNSRQDHQDGYYVEVLLDGETRGKTVVKHQDLNPLWGEMFEFLDLPAVLSSASVLVKRRPPAHKTAREQQESRLVHEAYGIGGDQIGGFSSITFDQTCGKVEIYLDELEASKEVEKWWPVMNSHGHRVGEILIRARAEEGVILMARDYQPLSDLLHRFSNGLTLQLSQIIPNELKKLSECLLNIFQVTGQAGEWIMSLVEEEIDGVQKETPISRLRYSRRLGSTDSNEAPNDRELIVRDLNKNATLEANLLFRGNTLLTKSLDSHMKRVGKEYLEQALGPKIREINEKDPDCEVDPNRVESRAELERNWRRLMLFTQEMWKAISTSRERCPLEIKLILRHIRACAEDRYGDFLRSVSYSSVSGFLFLRFFCPAVLNPNLFGLLKGDIKPRARRAFTLIAKALQGLANMASFGTKEHWMEPMNAFLSQHREGFKSFIDDICFVRPSPSSSAPTSPSHSSAVPVEMNLSYSTPMAIMQRLPPTSREGFPSLPYLIDHARAFAELVQLWLEATTPSSLASSTASGPHINLTTSIKASDGDLLAFHNVCIALHSRTQECLNRAERAERPNSALSFQWEELIEQLQQTDDAATDIDVTPSKDSFDAVADSAAAPRFPGLPGSTHGNQPVEKTTASLLRQTNGDSEDPDRKPPAIAPAPAHTHSEPAPPDAGSSSQPNNTPRRPRTTDSPTASASGVSNVSSPSSDTEASDSTTALPKYSRERQKQALANERPGERDERERQRQRLKGFVPALRKKR